jgi:hypothetical protein
MNGLEILSSTRLIVQTNLPTSPQAQCFRVWGRHGRTCTLYGRFSASMNWRMMSAVHPLHAATSARRREAQHSLAGWRRGARTHLTPTPSELLRLGGGHVGALVTRHLSYPAREL